MLITAIWFLWVVVDNNNFVLVAAANGPVVVVCCCLLLSVVVCCFCSCFTFVTVVETKPCLIGFYRV